MATNGRALRSRGPILPLEPPEQLVSLPVSFVVSPGFTTARSSTEPKWQIQLLSDDSNLAGLNASDLGILRKKQRKLISTAPSTREVMTDRPALQNALEATYIFAQHEAGTALCIDPAGWLLTCSHCIGETEAEWKAHKRKWLLAYNGLAVQVECRAWDGIRDLALLRVIAVETDVKLSGEVPQFRSVPLSQVDGLPNTPILCIGQPGRDDLESSTKRKTKYNLFEVSEGRLRGMVHGADPHNNSGIGSLRHDAWTYWGHSGAPLVRKRDGFLMGLHSSWDDQTTMRHGIPIEAVHAFLRDISHFETRLSSRVNLCRKQKAMDGLDGRDPDHPTITIDDSD